MINIIQDENWLAQQAKTNPDLTAIISPNANLTYKELYDRSLSIALQFDNFGLQPQDHVALISKNNLESVLVICAAWLRGCIPVVINGKLTSRNIKHLISHADARLVIYHDNSFDPEDGIKTVRINELFKSSSRNTSLNGDTSRESALIYTSGTSGAPKGVPITFSSLYKSISAIDAIDNYSKSDRFLLSLPLFHIGGFSILVRSILAGAALVIPNVLNLSNISSKLAEYKPSIVSVVPTMLKVLVENETVIPESLRIMYVGGGRSEPAIIKKAIDMKYPVVKVYGSTETCAMITHADSKILQSYPDSSGKVIGNTNIEIVDEERKNLEPDNSGEIVIQSESLLKGYYRNQIETQRRIIKGKYYSGDMGYLDPHGNLFVVSRREDLIVTGGENVVPTEIVSELNKHPEVLDSAVFGVEDAHWGQIVCTAIVTNDNEAGSAEEISRFLKKELPSFKIPKQYYFVDSLPYNDSGKVNVAELKRTLILNT
jgi:O-succinylbenzoic acid--CoA ligase